MAAVATANMATVVLCKSCCCNEFPGSLTRKEKVTVFANDFSENVDVQKDRLVASLPMQRLFLEILPPRKCVACVEWDPLSLLGLSELTLSNQILTRVSDHQNGLTPR
jgi:hypothetical protein